MEVWKNGSVEVLKHSSVNCQLLSVNYKFLYIKFKYSYFFPRIL